MLQITNQTPFSPALGVFTNPDGVDCVYGMLRATFTISGNEVHPSLDQLPVVPVDEYWGEPELTSLRSAGEMTLSKPATDILMLGHAYAPGGTAQQSVVRVTVGSLQKTVYVFGNRVWLPGVTGYSISEPQSFQKIPLKYEYAFGGFDPDPIDPKRPDYEPRNPVGRGLAPLRSHRSASSRMLPNLEDPKHLINSPLDRPAPASFGPVCPQWEPRRSFAGSYDEAWENERAPFLPLDFDTRFLQLAPAGLVCDGYLIGGESVEIMGATPSEPMRFNLPSCTVQFTYRFRGQNVRHTPVLDTVLFEPDENRFSTVWRDCLIVDKWLPRMERLTVDCAEFPIREAA